MKNKKTLEHFNAILSEPEDQMKSVPLEEMPQPEPKQIRKSGGFMLVVKTPFDDYKKSDVIVDQDIVDSILASYKKNMVLKVKHS